MAAATVTMAGSPAATFDPAIPPPPGQETNLVNPESLIYYSNSTIAACTSLVTFFFVLRCFVRIRYKKIWNLEDWLITISWVGTVAFMALLAKSTAIGGGKHLWDINKGQAVEFAYWFNIIACEYAVAICMTKVAILWLYRRAFSSRKGSAFEISCFVLIAINVCYYGATLLAKIFECTPRAKILNPTLPGTCISIYKVLVSDGIFNVITDFIILLLPALIIYRLQIETRKKIIVLAIFTFGLLAPAFSIVGFYMRLKHGGEVDVTWNLPQIVFWGGAEIATGTMCVCLPELGLLFNRGERSASSSHPQNKNNKPTASVLHGAKDMVLLRSSRHGAHTLHSSRPQQNARSWNDLEFGALGLDRDHERDREHENDEHPFRKWAAKAAGGGSDTSTGTGRSSAEQPPPVYGDTGGAVEMPDDAVHVRYDFRVDSRSYSQSSMQNLRGAYAHAQEHGQW